MTAYLYLFFFISMFIIAILLVFRPNSVLKHFLKTSKEEISSMSREEIKARMDMVKLHLQALLVFFFSLSLAIFNGNWKSGDVNTDLFTGTVIVFLLLALEVGLLASGEAYVELGKGLGGK